MFGRFFRVRPHWYALVFHYGLGIAVAWQFVEDLALGQGKVHSGEFFPWRRYVDWHSMFGDSFYWILAGAEAVLLVLYFLRIRVGFTAAALAVVLFVDNLGSFLNHRLLMSIEMLLVSFVPVSRTFPAGLAEKKTYWNLDLVRWQAAIVYLVTAIHKMNPEFLSGRTLHNMFFMLREQNMRTYSEGMFAFLQDPLVCMGLAWATVALELALVLGLNSRSLVGWFLPLAAGMHASMAGLMAYIWIFTTQMFFLLVAFLPDRTPDGTVRLRHGKSQGPLGFLSIVIPGTVEAEEIEGESWHLVMPDGEERRNWDAWLVLLSLSPLTFGLAETLRVMPFGERRRRPAETA